MFLKKNGFEGGVHPEGRKELSENKPITEALPPAKVTVPLLQHIGSPCKPMVDVGQLVKKGEPVGKPSGYVSSPVHSSVSGKVAAIGEVPHPAGFQVPAVVIENDFKETAADPVGDSDYSALDWAPLIGMIYNAGIVGMGGAAFPTHVKLSPAAGAAIDTLLINGAECEPYLTGDYRLMLEKPDAVVGGARIIMKILKVSRGIIGIESNKMPAANALRRVLGDAGDLSVAVLPVKYPQGAEKMLIKALLGRSVPPRKLPLEVGVVVQNVSTAVAVSDAVLLGRPLIERVVTVTGEGVKEPKNLLVRIGTPVADCIEQCGGITAPNVKILSGGPMMGFSLASTGMPVTKGTSGIVVLPVAGSSSGYGACIKCGRCIDVCPMRLVPYMLGNLSERAFYEQTREYHLHDCFECGSCTWVCPAKRPIVQFVKLAKSLVKP